MNVPPDLSDPVQRGDYRRELQAFERPFRVFSVGFTTLAVLIGIFGQPFVSRQLGWMLIGTGGVLMIVALVRRNLYHWRRIGWRKP